MCALLDAHDKARDLTFGGDRDIRERVEELVVAEHSRQRIGPAPRVDDRAGGMREAAGGKQNHGECRGASSCGRATTATQPCAIPVSAASHFGAATQRLFAFRRG